MATDARLSTGLPSHPKTKKLIKRLGQPAAWNLVCLILWVASNRSDGDLSGMSVEDIELASDWCGDDGVFVQALIDIRFLDVTDDGHSMHDWETHNPWAAGSNRRSEVAKANAAKKWGGQADEGGLTNAQKRSARLAEARAKGTHTDREWDAMKWVCGYACVACGTTERDLSKDHIQAIVKGGSDAIDNIQPMCHRCNASKGANGEDKRPQNWREMLAERLRNVCSSPSPSPSPSPSLTPTVSAEDVPPDEVAGHAPTQAGVICRAIKRCGIGDVNPGHPRLAALIEAGATEPEFTGFARTAAEQGKGFAWVLGAVEGERKRAASMSTQIHRGQMPQASTETAWQRTQRERVEEATGGLLSKRTTTTTTEATNAAAITLG